ncbi:MAG: autotransporter outer membrane beta-barrel domain-containing protein [Hyphomicrobiales bacterium]|nr:autotransporter outer membrane beta-barrel domain-containing protein [Hyphomicrobiales bacterium]
MFAGVNREKFWDFYLDRLAGGGYPVNQHNLVCLQGGIHYVKRERGLAMQGTNHKTKSSFVIFLTGMVPAVALGLTFALSTPAFALGGGGGGGSAPATPKITKAEDPGDEAEKSAVEFDAPILAASESRTKDPDEDKTPNKPDERTNNFPEPEVPEVVEAVVGFTAASATRIEEGSTAKLYVALSESVSEAVVLSLRLEGSATKDSDYSLLNKVSIPQGTRIADVVVSIQDDIVSESDETITITLEGSLPQGVSFGTRSHTVTIPANDQVEETPEVVVNPEDEDKPENKPDERTVEIPGDDDTVENEVEDEVVSVSVGFKEAASRINEGDSKAIEVVLSEPFDGDNLALPFYVGGNAVRGNDFDVSGAITFSKGEDSSSVTISVHDDAEEEYNEIVEITLDVTNLPDNMHVGNESHVITIIDNDPEETEVVVDDSALEEVDSVVGFVSSTSEISEGGGKVVYIEAHVTPPSSESISGHIRVSGTATGNGRYSREQGDYRILWEHFRIPANTERKGIIQLAVFDDDINDENETITFTLSGRLPEGVKFGATTHTVTIIDNDEHANSDVVTVGFAKSVTDYSEDVGSVTAEIVLSEPLEEPLTVTYKSRPPGFRGRHSQAIDLYSHSGSLTFQPGETSKSFLFDVADDRLREWREYITFVLADDLPEGVEFSRRTHMFMDYDNDYVDSLTVENHTDGIYVKEYGGEDILIENDEHVIKIEALQRSSNSNVNITIENSATVDTDIVARNFAGRSNGFISIKNGATGTVGGNVIGKHHSEGNIRIENHGRIGGDIRTVHFDDGDISIENTKTANVAGDIEATHYGVGDISIINRDYVRTVNIRHLGSGVVRYNGDINNRLSIVGNYEGSDDRQLNFHVRSDSDYAQMDVEGDVTGQSSVSLIVGRNANIGKDTHFPELIVVDSNYDAPSGSFTGEQTIGAFDYVLEYHKDDSHEEHVWEFVNKGLSDTAQENAKIPDDTKKDINTPPATDPDKKKELGLWGGADSSHTDIGLSFPAFVSNDDYHVGSQVQYYLKEDRTGIRALVETEYDFDIMNFRITPHARLTWTRVGFDDFVGPNRERVSLVDGDTVDLGLGLSFDNEYQISNGLTRIYGGANLLSPLDGETSVRISGFTIVNEQDDLSVDGKLGLSYEWGEGYAVHGEVSTLRNDDAEEIRANLGLDIDF